MAAIKATVEAFMERNKEEEDFTDYVCDRIGSANMTIIIIIKTVIDVCVFDRNECIFKMLLP
jgi:hypothetical protein